MCYVRTLGPADVGRSRDHSRGGATLGKMTARESIVRILKTIGGARLVVSLCVQTSLLARMAFL